MLPTPSTTHINPSQIYEPAEDSYLLLDTLSSASETAFLSSRFPATTPAPLVLEVGTGSGVVLAFLNAHAEIIFGHPGILTLGVDVNAVACEATAQTVRLAVTEAGAGAEEKQAGRFLGAVTGDLTTPLRAGEVDVLVFNPPYVPTETLPLAPTAADGAELTSQQAWDRDSHLLELSYAGGAEGMETTQRLLDALPQVLSPRGVAYILLCAQNKPRDVAAAVREWPGGWNAEIVGSSGRKAGWEKLCILRIMRSEV